MSSFTDNLIVSPLPDGRKWVIRRNFYYDVGKENSGNRISVPVGFITDFATVPRIFWTIFPKWGKYGNAAVIHDFLYTFKNRSRKEADNIFYEGMLVSKTPLWKAKIIYCSVRLFGWIAYKKKDRNKKVNIVLDEKFELNEIVF